MKLHILSDLHLEMMKPPYSWRIPETAGDLLVLAGDIGTGAAAVEWAIAESERLGKPALYVPGNHEYYNQQLSILDKMRAIANGSCVYLLDIDSIAIDGVRFLCTTLWTDYRLNGDAFRRLAMEQAQHALSDHRLINQPEGFSPAAAIQRNKTARDWLEGQLKNAFDGRTVVVSHHAPSVEGTHPRFRDDILTAAFVSNYEDLIRAYRPRLWIHGHTHYSTRYSVGDTTLIANQMGYRHRPAAGHFDPELVIEI